MSPLDALPAQRLGKLSDEEFWMYAREQASGDTVPSTEKGRTDQYLECLLSTGACLLPLSAIEEVIPSPPRYTLLPSIPRWMPGLAGWQGEVIAVLNLEGYLSGVDAPSNCGLLLCTHQAGLALGLFVSAIGMTVTLDDQAIEPIDRGEGGWEGVAIVKGFVGEVPVLDVAALLDNAARQIGMTARYG